MSTLTVATRGNLYDVAKFKNKEGSGVLEVINTLVEANDILKDLPAVPANGGLSHSFLRATALPNGGTLHKIGGSWGGSKTLREQVVESLAIWKDSYQAPKDTFTTEDPAAGQALLRAEIDDHIEAMGQGWVNTLLKGNTVPTQESIVGLMKREPYNKYDNAFTFNVGGSGTDLRSCWLMAPDVNTIHTLYNPNDPTLGVVHEDKGEVFVIDPDESTSATAKHRWDILHEFSFTQGICIRNQKAVKRICNVDCGVSAAVTADLINTIINASLINAVKGKQWFLYCDERLYAKLVIGANDKLKVFMSDKNLYQTVLPMIGDNIIIRKMDALNCVIGSGETEVTAA